MLIVLFFHQLSRLKRYERILVGIVVFERGWVTLSANFRGEGGRPPTTLGVRKLESLGYHVALFASSYVFAVLIQYRRVTDTHTHTHTHTDY